MRIHCGSFGASRLVPGDQFDESSVEMRQCCKATADIDTHAGLVRGQGGYKRVSD